MNKKFRIIKCLICTFYEAFHINIFIIKICKASTECYYNIVRSIPDFPEPGIIFRDVTSVIQSPEGLKLAIDGLTDLIVHNLLI